MKYYFNKLDTKGKEIYKKIYYGFKNFDKEIKVKCKNKLVYEIYNMVLDDNPDIFFVNPSSFKYSEIFKTTVVIPEYVYTKEEVIKIKSQIDYNLSPILNELKNISSKLQQERYIHKYILSNIKYKYQTSTNDVRCHTIVGSFIDKEAVCDGISRAFKYLCDISKIPTNIVRGNAKIQDSDYEAHAWNMIRIENKWYHIDVTWDLNMMGDKKYLRYDYFNVNDTDIKKDHKNYITYDKCNSTESNFFYINNSIINSKKDLKQFFKSKINQIRFDSKKSNIYFKVVGDKIDEKSIIKIFQSSCAYSLFFVVSYEISMNKKQGVYMISIK